jgi:(1->4)-alpha-D-glucan 1-alpha-D-glucosylmutase
LNDIVRPTASVPPSNGSRRPVNTYRLQLNRDFGFRAARDIVPYLERLGVTELYVSPLFAAAPGSSHGYDICDPSRLNPDLGTEEEFEALVRELKHRDMGLILDFVPNHMGAHPAANRWWRDVLENGPSSLYSGCFDIDWDPIKPELKNKILLPILGDQYGRVLERGELRLCFGEGSFTLRYFDHDLPINPRPAAAVIGHNIEHLKSRFPTEDPDVRELLSIQTALWNLPPYTERDPRAVEERAREKNVCRERLSRLTAKSGAIRSHVLQALAVYNGRAGEARSYDLLHTLLEAQAYRLAYWRTAMDEINYRRFFDINELAGLRQENEAVFDAVHALPIRWAREGKITGIRLDHIDGLHDPAGYLARLSQRLSEGGKDPFYCVVEKITSLGEPLAPWPVQGTTGYDFLNDVNGLFLDPRSALGLKRFYSRFTGRKESFAHVVYQSKYQIMVDSMISELTVLAHALNRISEQDRTTRDFTLESLRRALRELIAAFPLYRTYVGLSGWTERDEKTIDTALARTRQRHPTLEPTILKFIRDQLLPPPGEDVPRRTRALTFAMKFQQYTAPVQAKGMEDTAFYRYNLLLSLNEVGGDPHRFGRSLQEFHDANVDRARRHPLGMLSTATHDTKRGEDARARINVLSELPEDWTAQVEAWSRLNAGFRSPVNGNPAPDRNDEYFIYQTLVGFWPEGDVLDGGRVDRLKSYLTKAMREAKTHSSWIHNNELYESAVHNFVDRVLTGPGAGPFLKSFSAFLNRVAAPGVWNSLSQVVLKNTAPGVPDLYQGNEGWDFHLADPDNRRPVDFKSRLNALEALASVEALPPRERGPALANLAGQWGDGRIKLFVTAAMLRFRRKYSDLFLHGDYVPLLLREVRDEHLVAFGRRHNQHFAVVLVPRRTARFGGALGKGFLSDIIKGARLALPPGWPTAGWTEVFTGRSSPDFSTREGTLDLEKALTPFPLAVLSTETGAARDKF